MPFDDEMIKEINKYCNKDLPDESFYNKLFTFIKNEETRDKIILEYKNARFFYKIFEGLHVTNEKLLIETKMQIVMYASIHEAIVSYVVFDLFSSDPIVKRLLKIKKLCEYSIPKEKENLLKSILSHDGKEIIPCFYSEKKVDKTKIRYDDKVNALYDMKLISKKMRADLIKIYEYRNTIHIEADLKKKLDYSIEVSKLAYRRVEGLDIELNESIINGNLYYDD